MAHLIRDQKISSDKLELARQFRKEATPSEDIVWQLLRNRRMFNLKWRRQQIIEGFVADFYCSELNVVLEIDGGVHDNDAAREYDELRSEIFESLGIKTFRIKNENCDEKHITKLITDIINLLLHTGEGQGEVGSFPSPHWRRVRDEVARFPSPHWRGDAGVRSDSGYSGEV